MQRIIPGCGCSAGMNKGNNHLSVMIELFELLHHGKVILISGQKNIHSEKLIYGQCRQRSLIIEGIFAISGVGGLTLNAAMSPLRHWM